MSAQARPTPLPSRRRVDGIATRSQAAFAYIVGASLLAFLVWSNVTVLDRVKRGAGKVIPQLQNQTVQHLEGGLVRDILVKEGDRVERGTVLMRIESSQAESELAQAALEIEAKRVRLYRLDAEASGAPELQLPGEATDQVKGFWESEKLVFTRRQQALNEQLIVIEQQYKQKQLELYEAKARFANVTVERDLVLRRAQNLRKLALSGAVSANEVIDSERNLNQIEGRLTDLTHDIPRTEFAVAELQSRQNQARFAFRADAEKERVDMEVQIAKLKEAISALKDRSVRSDVMATSSGVVNKLFVTTIGGVVKSGEPLVQIVPVDSSIAVEARISPADRAEIWPGLPAVVKISAYDYSVFGGLKGRVVDISPDALQDERGVPYFRVRLEAGSSDFGPDKPVVPGMLADIDIIAGQQTVISALLRPLRTLRDGALRQ